MSDILRPAPNFEHFGFLVRKQRTATDRKENLNFMGTEARTLAERVHDMALKDTPPNPLLVRIWIKALNLAELLEEAAKETHL